VIATSRQKARIHSPLLAGGGAEDGAFFGKNTRYRNLSDDDRTQRQF